MSQSQGMNSQADKKNVLKPRSTKHAGGPFPNLILTGFVWQTPISIGACHEPGNEFPG
jgi:hypothetical protein